VVIDSYSIDKTCEIASKALVPRVFQNKFSTLHNNVILQMTLLNLNMNGSFRLDADEHFTAALEECNQAISDYKYGA
jgi:hypothetical protein